MYTHEYLHMFWEDLGTSWTIKTEDEGARRLRNGSNSLQPTRRRRNTPQDPCLRFPPCYCPSQIKIKRGSEAACSSSRYAGVSVLQVSIQDPLTHAN